MCLIKDTKLHGFNKQPKYYDKDYVHKKYSVLGEGGGVYGINLKSFLCEKKKIENPLTNILNVQKY